jgi:hypothetical protein
VRGRKRNRRRQIPLTWLNARSRLHFATLSHRGRGGDASADKSGATLPAASRGTENFRAGKSILAARFFAPESCSRRQRMIPKKPVPDLIRDGHRFSDKIMRNEKAKNLTAAPTFVRSIRQWTAGSITVGCGTREKNGKEERRQNAERRNFSPTSALARGAAPTFILPRLRGRTKEGAARLPAFHCGSDQGDSRRPRLSASGHASRDSAGALDPVSPPQPGGGDFAPLRGCYPRRTCLSPAKHLARRS